MRDFFVCLLTSGTFSAASADENDGNPDGDSWTHYLVIGADDSTSSAKYRDKFKQWVWSQDFNDYDRPIMSVAQRELLGLESHTNIRNFNPSIFRMERPARYYYSAFHVSKGTALVGDLQRISSQIPGAKTLKYFSLRSPQLETPLESKIIERIESFGIFKGPIYRASDGSFASQIGGAGRVFGQRFHLPLRNIPLQDLLPALARSQELHAKDSLSVGTLGVDWVGMLEYGKIGFGEFSYVTGKDHWKRHYRTWIIFDGTRDRLFHIMFRSDQKIDCPSIIGTL